MLIEVVTSHFVTISVISSIGNAIMEFLQFRDILWLKNFKWQQGLLGIASKFRFKS